MPGQIKVTSSQFEDGAELPRSAGHGSVGGADRSPQLSFSGIPEGARTLAVTCFDPDAPAGGYCHWLRFGLSPSATSLPEGSGTEQGEWVDGTNDGGGRGFRGAAPPAGARAHRYQFSVYALDLGPSDLDLDERTSYARFRAAISGHVLAEGTLTGHFAVSR